VEELNLTLPAQQQTKRLLVDTNPERIRAWLKSLPYADMERSLEQVVSALYQLNRTYASEKARADCMHCFLYSYQIISGFYRGTQNHNNDFFNNFLKLTREMSYGFKLIVKANSNKRLRMFKSKKHEASHVFLTLHFLGLLLIEHFERYEPVPAHIWYEINQLFRLAETKDYHLQKIQIEDSNLNYLPNISTTFTRICLCSVANPFQLSAGSHWQVFCYLGQYVKHVELENIDQYKEKTDPKELLCIDLSEHDSPGFIQLSEHNQAKDNTAMIDDEIGSKSAKTNKLIVFNLERLLEEIISHREKLEGATFCAIIGLPRNAQPQDVSLFLRTIYQGWKGVIKRSQPRYEKSNQLEIRCHLQEVIHTLKQNDPLYGIDNSDNEAQSPPSHITHGIFNSKPGLKWSMINAADGGACVHRSSINQTNDFVVGQIVILRECGFSDTDSDWSLAIIRWQKHHQGKSLGLEYFRGDASVVNIVQTFTTEEDALKLPSILVKAGKYGGQSYAIITRRGLCKKDSEICIEIGGENLNATTVQLVERTPFFDFYSIKFESNPFI
jgi:cyclic-di-GMP-binding protein